jgi:hypothetical protein
MNFVLLAVHIDSLSSVTTLRKLSLINVKRCNVVCHLFLCVLKSMCSHSIHNRYISLYKTHAYKQYGIISPQDERLHTSENELLTVFNHALVMLAANVETIWPPAYASVLSTHREVSWSDLGWNHTYDFISLKYKNLFYLWFMKWRYQ